MNEHMYMYRHSAKYCFTLQIGVDESVLTSKRKFFLSYTTAVGPSDAVSIDTCAVAPGLQHIPPPLWRPTTSQPAHHARPHQVQERAGARGTKVASAAISVVRDVGQQ